MHFLCYFIIDAAEDKNFGTRDNYRESKPR